MLELAEYIWSYLDNLIGGDVLNRIKAFKVCIIGIIQKVKNYNVPLNVPY